MNYYNDNNPKCAAALRQLVADGLIPKGYVDDRSITEVTAADLRGFTQCHFFAGIGGWPLALRLAGWPDDRPVWTGSAPCQDYSLAGKIAAQSGQRHLWPHQHRLIAECRPCTFFGEQVASAIAFGWLDDVFNGLEAEEYACAAAVLPACAAGAPHIRERLWFVADTESTRGGTGLCEIKPEWHGHIITNSGGSFFTTERCSGLEHSSGIGQPPRGNDDAEHERSISHSAGQHTNNVANTNGARQPQQGGHHGEGRGRIEHSGQASFMGHTEGMRSQGRGSEGGTGGWPDSQRHPDVSNRAFWASGEWRECRDGKKRLIESRIRLLVNGFSERVGLISAGGNAIVAPLAAEFIGGYMEVRNVR